MALFYGVIAAHRPLPDYKEFETAEIIGWFKNLRAAEKDFKSQALQRYPADGGYIQHAWNATPVPPEMLELAALEVKQ